MYACLTLSITSLKQFKDTKARKGFKYGNPFSFLKLQRKYLDPLTPESEKSELINKAVDLGLEVCKTCPGCKCGIGINLKEDVIMPLLKNSLNK